MLKNLLEKYRDMIAYLIFGVLTTVINIVVYWAAAHLLHIPTVPSTVIAWIAAVLGAYLTNRKWVFHSKAVTRQEIVMEGISFYLCRLGTGVLDWLGMYVMVDVLHWNDLIVKIAVNIIVIILNYVASKLIVFRKRGKAE